MSARRIAATAAAAAALVVAVAHPAAAQEAGGPSLSSVIDGLRNLLVGLLAGLATLFLTVGGVRYISAGGDPSQVEKAKIALRSAAVGYGLAALAPMLVGVLKGIVGG